MRRDCRHPDQVRDNQTQNSRSLFWRRGRLQVRRRTASCWRSARFSRDRSRRLLKAEYKPVKSSQSRLNMPGVRLAQAASQHNALDGILAKDRMLCGLHKNFCKRMV
jgi:hypothetical protein